MEDPIPKPQKSHYIRFILNSQLSLFTKNGWFLDLYCHQAAMPDSVDAVVQLTAYIQNHTRYIFRIISRPLWEFSKYPGRFLISGHIHISSIFQCSNLHRQTKEKGNFKMKKIATLTAVIALGLSSYAFADNKPPVPFEKQPAEHNQKQPPRDGKQPQHKSKESQHNMNGDKSQHRGDKPQHDGKRPQHNDGKHPPKDGKKPLVPQDQRN
ncbi:hypothetical protein [Enterobacter sp. Tr-810]|uniref:hypothetical protein n=1 Tax=Enterobacter sp. Tr-810 TaxID=2608347 RepID=UPI001FFC688B|nr:hypothetical protein [Enterobacter sp. Tr-810]